jgi:acetoin utilization deacetylase AcuC-like enzyme
MKISYDQRMDVAGATGELDIFNKAGFLLREIVERRLPHSLAAINPADWELLRAVHAEAYLEAVRSGSRTVFAAASMDFSSDMLDAQLWNIGSLISACTESTASGIAFSPSAHFHHAHFDSPGVYCLLNGLVLAALAWLRDGSRDGVLILDCDFHYGNGTDHILARIAEKRIAHESLGRSYHRQHQAKDYLERMAVIARDIVAGRYGGVIYQAGMDVLLGDPAGGGLLSYRQAFERDAMVFAACQQAGVPIAWNLAGGYKRDELGTMSPVIRGHLNTVLAALRSFEEVGDETVELHGFGLSREQRRG